MLPAQVERAKAALGAGIRPLFLALAFPSYAAAVSILFQKVKKRSARVLNINKRKAERVKEANHVRACWKRRQHRLYVEHTSHYMRKNLMHWDHLHCLHILPHSSIWAVEPNSHIVSKTVINVQVLACLVVEDGKMVSRRAYGSH